MAAGATSRDPSASGCSGDSAKVEIRARDSESELYIYYQATLDMRVSIELLKRAEAFAADPSHNSKNSVAL